MDDERRPSGVGASFSPRFENGEQLSAINVHSLTMVVFFTSNVVSPPCSVYMGKDKVENEDLIRYGTDLDVWFHVDKVGLRPSSSFDGCS